MTTRRTMIRNVLLVLRTTIVLFRSTAIRAAFNFTTCPAWYELQSDNVKNNFDVNKMFGTYYELAYHDYTQYPTCPFGPTCVRSVKRKETIPESPGFQIVDWFSIDCAGRGYPFPLRFNVTDTPGLFEGYVKDPPLWWKILEPGEVYPDVVVDFLEGEDGTYEWVIEFQCKYNRRGTGISFTGINFYSKRRNVSDAYMKNFLRAGRDRGLGVYMDKGFGTRTSSQTDCTYPDIPPV